MASNLSLIPSCGKLLATICDCYNAFVAELKTKKTSASVAKFIASVRDEQKRKDAQELIKLFRDITKEKPSMWGSSIVGFGSYHYKSERSAQEGDWPLTGFSPRKQNLTIYIMPGFKKYGPLLKKLGKHSISGGSCIYIKRLSDIHLPTLRALIRKSVAQMRATYR
jgi:hypothetical protein